MRFPQQFQHFDSQPRVNLCIDGEIPGIGRRESGTFDSIFFCHQNRVSLVESDGLSSPALHSRGPFDLILCNPPYVNAQSMGELPPEYRSEPALALDGNRAGGTDGMDFIRALLKDASAQMAPGAILVLEVGHERHHFEAAFFRLEVVWLETSAGGDQVLVVTRDALMQWEQG